VGLEAGGAYTDAARKNCGKTGYPRTDASGRVHGATIYFTLNDVENRLFKKKKEKKHLKDEDSQKGETARMLFTTAKFL